MTNVPKVNKQGETCSVQEHSHT